MHSRLIAYPNVKDHEDHVWVCGTYPIDSQLEMEDLREFSFLSETKETILLQQPTANRAPDSAQAHIQIYVVYLVI